MEKYKRLTERYIDKDGNNCVRKLAWDGEILHTLAELEDKIENGTLIELPCKVGDRVWYLGLDNCLIEGFIKQYKITNSYQVVFIFDFKTKKSFYMEMENLNKTWFLTKAEAETKLKEQL